MTMNNGAGLAEMGDSIGARRRVKEWAEAESDAKFLKKISVANKDGEVKSCSISTPRGRLSCLIPEHSESFKRFASRQQFLRSYTFSKRKYKDTITEKANKWFKVKDKKGSCSYLKTCIKFLLPCLAPDDVHA